MKAMTVGELIERLEGIDDKELPVGFSYNYGDHWHTRVVADVTDAEEAEVIYSDYHNMNKMAEDENDDPDNFKIMVVLS
jgi:hypothetical protein